MPYEKAHAPIYGYMKGTQHTIPLHLVHYARTFSIFKLLNTLESGSVLNVGGADGYHSYLIQKIFKSRVITLDINEKALEIAHRKYGLEVKQASALDIPFEDNSFDTVICIETIEHIEDAKQVISELKRVAKKYVVISTESYFDTEDQKRMFLLYLRETHPFLFRKIDPVKPSDVSHFTVEYFKECFQGGILEFFPQFSYKQYDIIAPIEEVRYHVKRMTENLPVNKRTKIIVLFRKGDGQRTLPRISEDELLENLISDEPLFPQKRDAEMDREDLEHRQRIQRIHEEKAFCNVVDSKYADWLKIEEEGAKGMALQWLTADDNERSPDFCTRKVRIEPGGHTPVRQTDWEHQIYILSGKGKLVEQDRETELYPGLLVHVRKGLRFKVSHFGNDIPLVYLHIIPSITHYFGR